MTCPHSNPITSACIECQIAIDPPQRPDATTTASTFLVSVPVQAFFDVQSGDHDDALDIARNISSSLNAAKVTVDGVTIEFEAAAHETNIDDILDPTVSWAVTPNEPQLPIARGRKG